MVIRITAANANREMPKRASPRMTSSSHALQMADQQSPLVRAQVQPERLGLQATQDVAREARGVAPGDRRNDSVSRRNTSRKRWKVAEGAPNRLETGWFGGVRDAHQVPGLRNPSADLVSSSTLMRPRRGRKGAFGLRQGRHHHLAQQRRVGQWPFRGLVGRPRRPQDFVGRDSPLIPRQFIAAPRSAYAFQDAFAHQCLQNRLEVAGVGAGDVRPEPWRPPAGRAHSARYR